jgi:uncharacterized protein (DUF1330 family)
MAKKGYWVVCYKSIDNPAVFSEYQRLARIALDASGGHVIVGGLPAKVHEAGINQTVVIAEFETLEKALMAYETDLYKEALRTLGTTVQRDFRILEGR